MAFRAFRLIVGLAVGFLAAWLIVDGAVTLARPEGVGAGGLVGPASSIVGGLVILGLYYWALWSGSRVQEVMENIFSIPELLGKLAFTLALLCIYRVGFHVPLPGLDQASLQAMAERQAEGGFGQAMAYFGMFTGGSLQQSTLFGLGIMPYISASIIFQLLTTVVPSLERLQREGPAGQRKIQEYTRYATVLLCIIQGVFWMNYMRSQGLIYPEWRNSVSIYVMGVFGLTAATVFLMWLGEQIDEYGIGNGISLLILAGIITRLPWAIRQLAEITTLDLTGGEGVGPIQLVVLIVCFVAVVAGAILITQAQRRIPVQQAKHTRGRRVYGGQRQYLPLRVNHGGVLPIIFASSLMIFPGILFQWLQGYWPQSQTLQMLAGAFQAQHYVYNVVMVAMIFFFAYFWTTVQFRPKEMAEQLRDYGSFIPGLRPGKRTADYLERVMERITYCGAAFLAIIAVIPQMVSLNLQVPFQVAAYLGGTGLLIMVSVTLDLVQRIEANLVMRNYGGFLGGSTRIKGAYR